MNKRTYTIWFPVASFCGGSVMPEILVQFMLEPPPSPTIAEPVSRQNLCLESSMP